MKSLVGYTGFVGSNLAMSTHFDGLYNHSNISSAFGTNPDLLVYAGVPAQKFMANKFPEEDLAIIKEAIQNIKKINPKQLVLISTIDVYENPYDVDETTKINPETTSPYGKNRFFLEEWVREHYSNALIVRLPALFGRNIKKNFVYDLIHFLPSLLSEAKFTELSAKEALIKKHYLDQGNGFYKLTINNPEEETNLKRVFERLNFSALNFTDSRATYQFYNLKNLWSHIELALQHNLKLLCLATEPVSAGEIYSCITGETFVNELDGVIPHYDYKSINYQLFGGKRGYLVTKKQVLEELRNFVKEEQGLKLSVSNLAWDTTKDKEVLEVLKELGFRGLEIAPSKLFGESPYINLEEPKKYTDYIGTDFGLSICSMQSIWYKRSENIFSSENDRKTLLDYTFKAIDFAACIGCKNLVFGCPKNRTIPSKLSKKEAVNVFCDFLKEINSYASEKGVYFSLEANPAIYNTNFLNTTTETAKLINSLKLSNIRLNLDFGTIIQNREKIADIAKYLPIVQHVHISEPFLVTPKHRRKHKQLAELLKEAHYSGFVSLEMKEPNTPDNLLETLSYLKGVFQ